MANEKSVYEVNFDGLIGPTHHFGGLALGNIASMTNKGRVSNPRSAALQGLSKMKTLRDLGLKQAVIPPVCRPDFTVLKNLGFSGSPAEILTQLASQPPELITAFFSASSMWTANCATISPSADTKDGKVHLTPANLTSKFHRAVEPAGATPILKAIFSDEAHFKVHDPVFGNGFFGDEGAANHTRFCNGYGESGLEFFVYGHRAFGKGGVTPSRFPARQSLEASQAVARLHGLRADQIVFGQQNPVAIDEGAFHNDVVSVGNRDFLFYHEDAFYQDHEVIAELEEKYHRVCGGKSLRLLKVSRKQVPLKEAVKSYLFNSQLLTLADGQTLLLAPIESEENEFVHAYLKSEVGSAGSPIQQVKFVDLRESMLNGGGPACLRLRVVLNEQELQSVNPGVILTDALFAQLEGWIQKHYREQLSSDDLCAPEFIAEIETALDELTRILKLGSVYPFQR